MIDIKSFNKKYKNILVTGGAGAIGFNLVRAVLDLNPEKVIIIDDLSSGHIKNIPKDKRIIFVKGDIADDIILKKAFKQKIDLVFHLAAHFANQNSIEHPIKDLLSNGLGTLKLLELSRANKVKKFVYFSTSCIYKSKDEKLKETDLDLQFETPYAISKYIGEKYVNFYHQFHDLPTVVLRIFNSFGPGERSGQYRNVIPNFMYRGFTNRSLIITGTGKETRNFTFVGNIVLGAIKAAMSKKTDGQTINLGSDRKITILQLANHIKKLTGNKKEIIFKPRRKWDNSTVRDGSLVLAKKLINFKATTPFKIGLAIAVNWMKGELKLK